MTDHRHDRAAQPDPTDPADALRLGGPDELDALLADPAEADPLGRLLAAAAAVETEQVVGEDVALAAYRAAFAAQPARETRFLAKMSGRAAALALAGGLVLTGGAAAAATGTLPDPVQRTTKGALAEVGVHVPGPNAHANEHAFKHRKNVATPKGGKPSATGATADAGNAVSDLARSTTATGADKGAVISGLASGGKSHAAQRSPAPVTPSPAATKRHHPGSHKPTHTPAHKPTHKSRHQPTPSHRPTDVPRPLQSGGPQPKSGPPATHP